MYKEQVRKIWVKCPNCINGPQVCRPEQKTRTCAFCGHRINVQHHIIKIEKY